MNEDTPLPCVFCESENVKVKVTKDAKFVIVACGDCGAKGPETDYSPTAIIRWNRQYCGDHEPLATEEKDL